MHNTIVSCTNLRHGQPVGKYRGFRHFINSTNSGRKMMYLTRNLCCQSV